MSFGLTFDKILIILVIAVFLVGPERLPGYAAQLARLTRSLRDLANGAKDRMREEMGPEFDEVDWAKLDPRKYDPRRIIRDALLEEEPAAPVPAGPRIPARSTATAYELRQRRLGKGAVPPFDGEAT
ncbi:MAG: Sec-independent protein translocase TatB [Protaetiibacter sp.]